MDGWERINNPHGRDPAYSVMQLAQGNIAMKALRALFPDGQANSMNFVLFSTSGTHGSYVTIEDAQREPGTGITFLVVQPRLVSTRYGEVVPETPDDFAFLYKLRESSWEAVSHIGA